MRAGFASLALLAACAGDTVRVPVELSIDGDTCTTTDPLDIAIDCDASIGVWVRDAADEALLHSACTALPTPTTLQSLPQALAGVDLSGITAEQIRVELAVFSPSVPGDCPMLPQGSVVAYAAATADLANRTPLTLVMQCELSTNDPLCEPACEQDYEDCYGQDPDEGGDDWFEYCVNQWEQCSVECQGDEGCSECSDVFLACYQDDQDGENSECRTDLESCLQLCEGGNEACYQCFDTYRGCRNEQCSSEYTMCLSQCAEADGCLRIDG